MPSPPAPEELPPAAAAVPSNHRSLRKQTSTIVAGRSKGKNKDTTDAPEGLSAADSDNLGRIGLGWCDPGETAGAGRKRSDENTLRMAAYAVNLEKSLATQARIARERNEELQLLIHEVRVACESHAAASQVPSFNLSADPTFRQLHTAVIENRQRLQVMAELPSPSTPLPSVAVPAAVLPAPPPLPAIPARRPLNDAFMPAGKRARVAARASTECDVLYGPVNPNGDARAIAGAAMEMVDHVTPGDVRNAIYAPGRPGTISIRFKEYPKALVFTTSVQASPPVAGQYARFADATYPPSNPVDIIQGNANPTASTSTAANPIDIIRGTVHNGQAAW